MAKMLVHDRQYDHHYAKAYWEDDDPYYLSSLKRNKNLRDRLKRTYRTREERQWRKEDILR